MVEGPSPGGYTLPRRGGRVVECGGLENRYVGNPGVGGSNPPLSAFQPVSTSAFQLVSFSSNSVACARQAKRHNERATSSALQSLLTRSC